MGARARGRRAINARHVNPTFLPGVALDPAFRATAQARPTLPTCDAVLLVAPAQHVRAVATRWRRLCARGQPLVICAKGIEQATGKLMGEVLAANCPRRRSPRCPGPSFAADVARGLPAALTLACADERLGQLLAERLGSRQFRLYWSSDLVGVELGGAVKNVLAIAAGIVDGKGLGASAHAALVTRGFAEMRRLGEALGARPETLIGLSGLGDLILTCGSPQSRNMCLGRALGRGETLAQALAGKLGDRRRLYRRPPSCRIAEEKGIDMPICAAVLRHHRWRASVDDAIAS